MIFLLDINVLIALIDPMHVQHDSAHIWFVKKGRKAWATCPITESSVLRIVGHPRYPNSPGTPAAVEPLMADLRALPGHVFWSETGSGLTPRVYSALDKLPIATCLHSHVHIRANWRPWIGV